MGGLLCNMSELKSFGIPIIEDCAHRYPEDYLFKGDLRVYSFYGNKLLTTCEGGMICFDDEKFLTKLIKLRYHGRTDYL